ncbi:hypothetical protein SAMN06265365_113136 [Tistlia consotensis]|uniref:SpoIIAA-like n=1 Tax=Tistlia consotensis USBA 355 TaxID=560819 RepID=A0A1Y6C700_9PROT|nr:hypothetical protein [Tistlia consotensis]SMF40307.1 hypothetical protein SAMN05428998_1149 [Tistlia consotensis USBA 355]SNR75097.1 hypothetical protein SAMN06265365_113136 [Tistlia consotensis]
MPAFNMTIDLDPNGVIVTVCEGRYDGEEWLRLRRELFESRYRVADYDGRPAVTDMRRCRLPKRDWATEFKIVADVMKREHRKPFRRAVIVSGEDGSELAVALLAEYQKLFHHPGVETRAFLDYDEGYAWALAGAPPADGDEGAPEQRTDAPKTVRDGQAHVTDPETLDERG